MTPKVLINLIVSQTTVLIAQLSTASGIRAPLGDIAGQVFLELARAIEAQGVPRKVVADMFGLAIRGYQKKVQRLEESATDRGSTLWEAVLRHVHEAGPLTRQAVEARFARDEYRSVAAVLNDLVTSGLLFRAGAGDSALYKSADAADVTKQVKEESLESLATLIWIMLYKEPGLSAAELGEQLSIPETAVAEVLAQLCAEGAIVPAEGAGFEASTLVIPVGAEEGWAAAVFDHYQAVASAIGTKIRAQSLKSKQSDLVGGTTLTFDVNDRHPHRAEVFEMLGRMREETDRVWAKVRAWNEENPMSEDERTRVTFYFGQSLTPLAEDEDA